MFACLVRIFFNGLTCFNPSLISKSVINHQKYFFKNINRSVFLLNIDLKIFSSKKQIFIFTKYRSKNSFKSKTYLYFRSENFSSHKTDLYFHQIQI